MTREQVCLKGVFPVSVATDGENGKSVPEEAPSVRILSEFKPELNRKCDHGNMGPNGGKRGRNLVPRVRSQKIDKWKLTTPETKGSYL